MKYSIGVKSVSGVFEVFETANTMKSAIRKFEVLFNRYSDEDWEWLLRNNSTQEITFLSTS